MSILAEPPPALVDDDPLASSLAAALDEARSDEYGAVFTRRWVVELILDLVGFTADRDLATLHAIEPACGDGAFLGPMVERIVESCRSHGRPLTDATDALTACDLQLSHVQASRELVCDLLTGDGRLSVGVAERIAAGWVRHDDFLLSARRGATADFVLGNPPYIRLEEVPKHRQTAYRTACRTMSGRADIFVGFYEVGLQALRPGGALGFICADRWMRNQYGASLREMVTAGYSVEATIEMHEVDAFAEEVSAYPSITIVRRATQGPVMVTNARRGFDAAAARRLRAWTPDDGALEDPVFDVARLPTWFAGKVSWPTGSPERLALLAQLESKFPPLEDPQTGTKVGIGVATGADSVFITKDVDIAEPSQLIPLALVRDTMTGTLEWSGHHLVSPWTRDGSGLVELSAFPLLAAYLEECATILRKRHVASRQPQRWFRTIDRVDPALTAKPKLLLPDIKASLHPVLDEGKVYPHHNLYWVTSTGWDVEALGGLLLSRVAQLFVESYAVRMRGGYLRFQAQYLRRIRVPQLTSVSATARRELRRAFAERDVDRATTLAISLYGIRELPA